MSGPRLTPERRAELERWTESQIGTFSDMCREAIRTRCQIAAIDGDWMSAAEDLTRYCAEQMFEVSG